MAQSELTPEVNMCKRIIKNIFLQILSDVLYDWFCVTLANSFPEGLEDVSKYPSLIEELLRRGWKETELKGVLRENFLRVFREVENVRLKTKLHLDSYERKSWCLAACFYWFFPLSERVMKECKRLMQ